MNKFKTMAEVWKYLDEHGIKSDIELVQAFNYVYEFALNDHDIITDEKTVNELVEIFDTPANRARAERIRKIFEDNNILN